MVVLLLLLCFSGLPLRAQLRHEISADLRPGYIFPTRRFLHGWNDEGLRIYNQNSVHLRYAFRFDATSPLALENGDVYQGIGIAYNQMQADRFLGNPISVYLFQGADLAHPGRRLSLNYEWNFGLAVGWKPYDRDHNPWNDCIGSKVTAYMSAGLKLRWDFSPQWSMSAGCMLAHYSNGNTQFPNFGINNIAFLLGVNRQLRAAESASVGVVPPGAASDLVASASENSISRTLRRRLSLDIVAFGAWAHLGTINGETYNQHAGFASYMPNVVCSPQKYAVLGININPLYSLSRHLRLGASVDAECDDSNNIPMNNASYEDGTIYGLHRAAFSDRLSLGVSARAEFVMPIFRINVGVGETVRGKGRLNKSYQIVALKTDLSRHLFVHVGYRLRHFKYPSHLMLGLGVHLGK